MTMYIFPSVKAYLQLIRTYIFDDLRFPTEPVEFDVGGFSLTEPDDDAVHESLMNQRIESQLSMDPEACRWTSQWIYGS